MALGLAYDSDEGRDLAGSITALLTGESYLQSTYLAERVEPFAHFEENRDSVLRVLGKHRAAEMVLLGRTFSARVMLAWGLVNEVCAPEALDMRAQALCEELAAVPAGAVAVAKRSLAGGLALGLREAMDQHVAAQTEAFARGRAGQAVPAC